MITVSGDEIYKTFLARIKDSLERVQYDGPMTAQALDLPGDLTTSLIELVFGILSGCLGASTSPEELARRVNNVNVIQQMHINNQVRKRIFKNNRRAYIAAGGGKLSNALILTMNNSKEGEVEELVKYIQNGTAGLTQYPEL